MAAIPTGILAGASLEGPSCSWGIDLRQRGGLRRELRSRFQNLRAPTRMLSTASSGGAQQEQPLPFDKYHQATRQAELRQGAPQLQSRSTHTPETAKNHATQSFAQMPLVAPAIQRWYW